MNLTMTQIKSLESYGAKIASESLETYLMIYHHRNTINQRCTLNNREWLVDILLDKCPRKVFMKAVQCGITNYLEVVTFAEMMRGHFVLYVMPSETDRNAFINTRIDPVTEAVPLYKAGRGKVDNVGIKQFWSGGLKTVGSNSKASFASYTAQTVNIDEVDLCNKDNLVFAEDRVSAIRLLTGDIQARLNFCGNPSVPGTGIAQMYAESDQKEYLFQCPGCRRWQEYNWFETVVRLTDDGNYELRNPSKPAIVCPHCNKILMNKDNLKSEWIAKRPELSNIISGYHITQMFTRQFTIEELYNDFNLCRNNPSKMQAFYNSRLGIPFTGSGDVLDIALLDKCVADYKLPHTSNKTVGGIDVGKDFHLRIDKLNDGKRVMQFAGTCGTEKSLIETLVRFGCSVVCMDADPETHTARRLRAILKKYNIQLLLVRYNTNVALSGRKINKETGTITVNRTESLDRSLSAYIHNQVVIPGSFRHIDNGEWVKQMMAPVRRLDINRNPPSYIWDEGNKPDHHRHADNYCQIASELVGFGNRQYKIQWIT